MTEQPDLSGLKYLGEVGYGRCPFCGWNTTYLAGVRTVSIAQTIRDGGTARCPDCNERVGADDLRRARFKRRVPRERRVEIRQVDANGKLLTVHYGPGHGVRDELSSRGKQLPDGFRGNGREMAAVMGRSADDLSREFGVSVAEFEDWRFDVGLSDLPKAGE